MMRLMKYEHEPFTHKPNKNLMPKTVFDFSQMDEFNAIYQYCLKSKFIQVKPTKSLGFPIDKNKYYERFMLVRMNQSFELVIVCYDGCYRFIIKNKTKVKENTISGQQACRAIYKVAQQFNVDMNNYACTSAEGEEIKKTIVKPHIEILNKLFLNMPVEHVYHIDFHSSYASRIIEKHPELREMYTYIYNKRKERDGFYKHVLTNSIGCWQSKFCISYVDNHRIYPYMLAGLSRDAVNGTRAKVEDMIRRLRLSGNIPLLSNTDGVWYIGLKGPFHGDGEGNGLCQWSNDHNDCKFLMTSVGSYQFEENGKCHTVVRGLCNLDVEEPDREKWPFGHIKNMNDIYSYRFEEGKGVVRYGTEEEKEGL